MATHSSMLAGKSHRQRNLAGCTPWGRKRVRHDLATKQQQKHPSIKGPVFRIYSTELKAPVFKIYIQGYFHYCLEEQKLELQFPSIAENLNKSQLILSIEYLFIKNNKFYVYIC